MRVWHDNDIDSGALEDKTVAIIGYGIQGRAQAANLRDSGVRVVVGGRKGGRGIAAARHDGFDAFETPDAVSTADIVMLLTPDDSHEDVMRESIAPNLKPCASVGFACGFSIAYCDVGVPENADVIMVAPKGPGKALRERFAAGGGLPALVAVERDASGEALDRAVAYAKAIGSGRAAVIESTFAEEADTDLFSEQVVLCGGIPALMRAAFDTLVDGGYSPEAAYIECVWEAKAVVDLIFERGIAAMYDAVSPAARYGGLTRGKRVIGEETGAEMQKILGEIRSGEFARELLGAGDPPPPERDAAVEDAWRILSAALKKNTP
jgi:ketol-acid reductoisomerase